MKQDTQAIEAKTIGLIDSLRTTCGDYGLAGGGSEYKIITEMFFISSSTTNSVMK